MLAKEFDSEIEIDQPTSDLRVVLGLIEGYNKNAPKHSIDEVRQALPHANITPAEVFLFDILKQAYPHTLNQ